MIFMKINNKVFKSLKSDKNDTFWGVLIMYTN